MKKIKIPIIKFTKTGKPYKKSLQKAKEFVKKNFKNLKKEDLPKEVKGYFGQIESGKKRGEANKLRLKNPQTGKFLTSLESKAVKDLVKQTSIDLNINKDELTKNKDLYLSIVDKALNDTISITKDTDLAIDFLKRQGFKKIVLVDQNGKEKSVNLENAIFILKENQKKIMQIFEAKKFSSWNRLTYNPAGRKIKINYVKVKNESAEELQDIIDSETESGNFAVYGS